MKPQLKSIALALGLFASLSARAQVVGYSFAHEQGQYTSITDPVYAGAIVTTHNVQDDLVTPHKIKMPFPFRFAGQLVDSVGIHGNGYIWFGPARPSAMTANWPLSSVPTAGVKGIVSAFGLDMHPQLPGSGLTSTVKSAWVGTAPMRMLIIEWEAYSRELAIDAGRPDTINVQIRLYESSDRVEINYGFCGLNTAITESGEVGIRGASMSDYSTRVLNSDWSISAAGRSAAAKTVLSSRSKPGFGKILAWQYWQMPTGIAESEMELGILTLYPVPASTQLMFSVKGYSFSAAQWVVRDISGMQLLSGNSEKGHGNINIGQLPAGNYVFELKDNLHCIRQAFTKL